MAWKMDYMVKYSNGEINYPDSYWKLVQVNRSRADKTGALIFYGYRSQQEAEFGAVPIDTITIPIDRDTYNNSFSADALDPEGINPDKAGYEYSAEYAIGAAPALGEEDLRKRPFANAVMV